MPTLKGFLSEKKIFYFLLLAGMCTVWYPTFLVQGDGPSHVYNSKILLELLQNKNRDFYTSHYNFEFAAVPNWLTHVCLAGLQGFFSPFISEKIFLTLYILLFCFSFRFLSGQFNRGSNYGSLLVFPLLFHFLYFYGFYNYCFAFGLALFFVAWWLSHRENALWRQLLVLVPLFLLVFFTHPFGLFFIVTLLSGLAIGELIIFFSSGYSWPGLIKLINRWLAPLIAAIIPFALSFNFSQNHTPDTSYHPESLQRLWSAFATLETINIYSDAESFIAPAFVTGICVLILWSVITRIKNGTGLKLADSFLISAGLWLFIYFKQPEGLSMGGFWIQRLSWVPWLILVLWLSCIESSRYIKMSMAFMGTLIFLSLIVVRMPFQLKNSDAEKDYLSACRYIPAKSVVLPLSYCNFGCDEKGRVINRIWCFQHAFDYSGAMAPNINLVNYEAATSWFPVQWKPRCNAEELLFCAECQPPHVVLDGLEKNGGNWRIDYVITFCMKYRDSDNVLTKSLRAQLDEKFTMVYESASGRTQLWKNKSIIY